MDTDNEHHVIYLAKRSTGLGDEIVLVKFTAKYNEVAHRLLAKQTPTIRPALYSWMRVIDGLYMIVMEYLSDAEPLCLFFPPHQMFKSSGRTLPRLLTYHREGFVFGELREVNVFYSPEDGGRAFLVDFDGVGEHGRDRYSPCLNTNLGLGMARWQIMDKLHDRANLERVTEWDSARTPNADRT
jgi:hypothetical protein